MFLVSLYRAVGYYVTLVLFGAFGLLLNAACLLLSWLPATPATERLFQRVIQWHFALFIGWVSLIRLVRVTYRGFEQLSQRRGLVLIANHHGLMDITYLLARIPEAVCIFKPAIRRNPILGAAARRAGYLASDGGIDLVRAAAEKVALGRTLVVFPEGTRSPSETELLPFKPGFALIAKRAHVPIQLVRIICDSNILSKRHTWWKVPDLPIGVALTAGPQLDVERLEADELVAQAAAWFKSAGDPSHGNSPGLPGFTPAT
jgi:1-acyl-sn-glycerol-3-phosphate acyltransferase